jgi:hypothetical protein
MWSGLPELLRPGRKGPRREQGKRLGDVFGGPWGWESKLKEGLYGGLKREKVRGISGGPAPENETTAAWLVRRRRNVRSVENEKRVAHRAKKTKR